MRLAHILLFLLVMSGVHGLVFEGEVEKVSPSIVSTTNSFEPDDSLPIYCKESLDGRVVYAQDPPDIRDSNSYSAPDYSWDTPSSSGYVNDGERWYIDCPDDLSYNDWLFLNYDDAANQVTISSNDAHDDTGYLYCEDEEETQMTVGFFEYSGVQYFTHFRVDHYNCGAVMGTLGAAVTDDYGSIGHLMNDLGNSYADNDLYTIFPYDDNDHTISGLDADNLVGLSKIIGVFNTWIIILTFGLGAGSMIEYPLYDIYPTTDSYYVFSPKEGSYRIVDNSELAVDDGDCSDGLDNDGDGLIDCADDDCNEEFQDDGYYCQNLETDCADGFDNDVNGLIDCLDPYCDESLREEIDDVGSTSYWLTAAVSADASDLEGPFENQVDYYDYIVTYPSFCEYETELTCNDGEDNDADGLVDCNDNDCELRVCNEDSGYICESGLCVEYIPDDVNYGSQQVWEQYSTGNYYSGLLLYLHDYIYHADDCGDDIELYLQLYESGIIDHKICVPGFSE